LRNRKLELEHFLNQRGADICLLSETFLNPAQAFRLANYVRHRTDSPTAGGGTAIQVILAGRLLKILADYLSPSRPLIGANTPAFFGPPPGTH